MCVPGMEREEWEEDELVAGLLEASRRARNDFRFTKNDAAPLAQVPNAGDADDGNYWSFVRREADCAAWTPAKDGDVTGSRIFSPVRSVRTARGRSFLAMTGPRAGGNKGVAIAFCVSAHDRNRRRTAGARAFTRARHEYPERSETFANGTLERRTETETPRSAGLCQSPPRTRAGLYARSSGTGSACKGLCATVET